MPHKIIATFPVQEILPQLDRPKLELTAHGVRYQIKVNQHLKRFREERTCIWCGKEGNHFLLMEDRKSHDVLLQLYWKLPHQGKVMMTLDHLIPISLGGSKSHQDNLGVMCARCNWRKGNKLPLFFVAKEEGWKIPSQDTPPVQRPSLFDKSALAEFPLRQLLPLLGREEE